MTQSKQQQDRDTRSTRPGAQDEQPLQPAEPPHRPEAGRPPGHAPGGGELDAIPDADVGKVAPDDPRETEVRDPANDKPWPEEHDGPDDAGDRPRPL